MSLTSKMRDLDRFISARRKYDAGWITSGYRFLQLTGSHQYSPNEVFLLGLLNPRLDRKGLTRFVSKEAMLKRQLSLNPKAHFPLTEDKLVFYSKCRHHELPTPRVLGAWGDCKGLPNEVPQAVSSDQWRDLCRTLPIRDVVLKPVCGVHGEGVMLLTCEGGEFIAHDGRSFSADALLQRMAVSGYSTWMFQERLRAHPDLAALSGTDCLQTARVVTFVSSDGVARVIFAWLRVIGGMEAFDNFNFGEAGNYVATLDLSDATVQYALGRNEDGFGLRDVVAHPYSGRLFTGLALPYGRQLFDLAERAAACFKPLRTIGWDVAITPDGVVLIEGNVTWDPLPTREDLGAIMAGMR